MKKIIGIVVGIVGCIAAVLGIIYKVRGSFSVAIIGGADGPTSVFVAGKVGQDFSVLAIAVGIILILAAAILLIKKKR